VFESPLCSGSYDLNTAVFSASVEMAAYRWHASNWSMIRKLKSGEYRIYSRHADKKTGKKKNLGTFASRTAAEKHERAIQYFKHG